jgi:hypothetical protein
MLFSMAGEPLFAERENKWRIICRQACIKNEEINDEDDASQCVKEVMV